MSIIVKPENEAYLVRLVAEGRYASIEDAANAAIVALRIDEGDLSWAKPYVESGLASLDRGEGVATDEAFDQLRAHMASRRS